MLILAVTLATITVSAAAALAQVGAPNPSGGTSLRQTVEEGQNSVGLADVLSSRLSFHLGVRSWLGSFFAARQAVATARPVADRTMMAILQQRVWRR